MDSKDLPASQRQRITPDHRVAARGADAEGPGWPGSISRMRDAVKRVGFTPGDTKVSVRGSVKGSKLQVAEIGKTFEIDGRSTEGDSVELSGTIAPPPDPRTPVVIRLAKP